MDSQKSDLSAPIDSNCLNFLNVFLNRIFYDIHKSEEVKSLLKNRIYNKLLKIKITQWFKTIELTEINMGSCLPRVSKISNVHQTDRGLWVELGVEYNGVASATIETCGLNLGEEDAAGQVSGLIYWRLNDLSRVQFSWKLCWRRRKLLCHCNRKRGREGRYPAGLRQQQTAKRRTGYI